MRGNPVADGVLRALTLAPGLAPLGLLFGAAAVAAGLGLPEALALSAFVFAGGAQFAAVALVAEGAAAAAIVGLVFLVNARYFLLSTATLELGRRAGATRLQRVLLALGTVDESYALQAAWARDAAVRAAGLLAVPATLWTVWVASTAAGALVGAALPDLRPLGLDYVLPGLFIGLLGVFADTRPRLLAGLAAVALEAALVLAGHGNAGLLLVPPALALALGQWRKEAPA